MLHVDPHRRLTAAEVLNSKWIRERGLLPLNVKLTLQDANLVKVFLFAY